MKNINWSNRSILITGIGGFIGHNLAKRLLERNVRIIGIDNFSYINKKWIGDIVKEISLVEGNINDLQTLDMIKEDLDFIFCFGTPSSVVHFDENPKKCYLETVLGTKNIFDFGKKAGVRKIILASSGSVYGGNEKPHKETVYPLPTNLYGVSKIVCENIASSFKPFVKSTVLRIFSGYGPGEERKGKFASPMYLFINDMLLGRSPIIYGDGNQERDFIYIKDVIESIICAAETNLNGIVNVGTGVPTSFSQLIEMIQKEIGKYSEPKFISKPEDYVDSLVADTTFMKKSLNVKPLSIEVGIREFVRYLQEKYP